MKGQWAGNSFSRSFDRMHPPVPQCFGLVAGLDVEELEKFWNERALDSFFECFGDDGAEFIERVRVSEGLVDVIQADAECSNVLAAVRENMLSWVDLIEEKVTVDILKVETPHLRIIFSFM